MECQTIREEKECVFMTKKGCSYKDGCCFEIIDKCEGCKRVIELPSGLYCNSYPEPNLKWLNGRCSLSTLNKNIKNEKKLKINPLKASKRASR